MFGDIIRKTVSDTEGNVYGDVDMGGWTIEARRFSAPIRQGFHYFGVWQGTDYAGPCNTAEDVWQEIIAVRAEVRPNVLGFHVDWGHHEHAARELERASIIALARKLDAATLDAEACAAGPGRYESASDLALVVSLDILCGHGCEDESAGSVDETGRYLARFGRFILQTDSRGFVSAWREDSEDAAIAVLDDENERYAEFGE